MTTTDAEESIVDLLVAALCTGTPLDLTPDRPLGEMLSEEEMHDWDDGHDVDADVLRDLLLLRRLDKANLDPRGLRLRGAHIRGRLDLDLVNTTVALRLVDCLLDHGLTARQAHLPAVQLHRCRLSHPDQPAFDGDDLRVDARLELDGSVLTAESRKGTVRLSEAQVGWLSLSGATLRNPTGPALHADGLQTRGEALLDKGFTAEGAGDDGAVGLVGARIDGRLWLKGATLRNPTGPALHVDGLQTGGEMFLDEGFTAEGTGDRGAVWLLDARIGGQLGLRGAALRNPSGSALVACGLQTDSDVFLDKGFTAEGVGDGAAVALDGARIGGQLCMSGADVRNPSGAALVASRLQTDSDVYLDEGFTAEAGGDGAAVALVGARIGGQLVMKGAVLGNPAGPGLNAEGLQISGSALLGSGFKAEGAGHKGAVRLFGAQIGGQLGMRDAVLVNPTGPALDAEGLQTHGNALLDEGFTADGGGDGAVIVLHGARIGGRVKLTRSKVSSRSDARHLWELDGFTYQGVPRLKWQGNRDAFLQLLRTKTSRYSAQPYQHLAAVYRLEGHESDARRILIAQREDQIARGGLGGPDLLWARITGVLLCYGYQPWRALLYLAGVLAISVGVALWLGGQGGLARSNAAPAADVPAAASTPPPATATAGAPASTPCTLVQTIGRGLDLGAPFLPAAPTAVGSCQPTTPPAGNLLTLGPWTVHAGDALTVARWVLQLIAWALAALFIAGFTGIVRKT